MAADASVCAATAAAAAAASDDGSGADGREGKVKRKIERRLLRLMVLL